MKLTATAEDYARAFERERLNTYPLVDAFEARMGYAIDREKMEAAARVLACPVKKNPPCWQHARVIYAATRHYLKLTGGEQVGWTGVSGHSDKYRRILDVGTAKGYSALCLQWALDDSDDMGKVTSVDVIDPTSRETRNTVAEVDGLKTLEETLAPWPEAQRIDFRCVPGIDWLMANDQRIHVAFVDGKHTGPTVAKEGWLLSQRQESGDLAIFDDVHLPEIRAAVQGLRADYAIEYLDILPNRGYAVAVKR